MYQLKIGTIPIPKLYVCENYSEGWKAKELGIPYLIKPAGWTDKDIVAGILWYTLYKKFPHIEWDKVLGDKIMLSRKDLKVHVPHKVTVEAKPRTNPLEENPGSSPDMEVTDGAEYRETAGGFDEEDHMDFEEKIEWTTNSTDLYIGDLGFHVNIEELQALRLLPVFLDDIANAIKINLSSLAYMDGYNKKLKCNLGTWKGASQAPNLIILDVSGSIPEGVSKTMVALIETLRHQANADLIITSWRSEYWPANTELPDNRQLDKLIGGCNECVQFYSILRKHVLGKHWGNVIIFGDQDSPMRNDIQRDLRRMNEKNADQVSNINVKELQSTRIDRIMSFHTYADKVPGYGLWAVDAAPRAPIVYNTEWVKDMSIY